MIWSPSTSSPFSSTASTRSASPSSASPSVGARVAHRAPAAARGYVDPQPALMLRPSGSALITSTRAPALRATRAARAPTRRRSRSRARRAARRASALERAEQVRDVRVDARRPTDRRRDVGGRPTRRRRSPRSTQSASQLGFDRGLGVVGRACGRRRRRSSRRCRSTGCGSPTRSRPGTPGALREERDRGRRRDAERPDADALGREARRRGRLRCAGPTRACHARRGTSSAPSTRAAARPSATTNGEVRSASASPRTPSVPKRSTRAPGATASSTAAPCGPS